MLKRIPETAIDDPSPRASKRQRLHIPDAGGVAVESACHTVKCEPSAQIKIQQPICESSGELGENVLVCYGMVRRVLISCMVYAHITQIADLKVHSPLHHAVPSISTQ
jgi:hypothetical protein